MNSAIKEFVDFLDKEIDPDYGDFKREVDLHLQRLIANLRPLNREQVFQLQKMREQLLWSYRFDVEEMRSLIRDEVLHLEDFNPPEL